MRYIDAFPCFALSADITLKILETIYGKKHFNLLGRHKEFQALEFLAEHVWEPWGNWRAWRKEAGSL